MTPQKGIRYYHVMLTIQLSHIRHCYSTTACNLKKCVDTYHSKRALMSTIPKRALIITTIKKDLIHVS